MREAQPHGVPLPFSGLLKGAQLERAVVGLHGPLDRGPGVVGRVTFDEDELGRRAHHRGAGHRRGHVSRLVAGRHDHADAGRTRRRHRPPIAQDVDPVERGVLHERRAHRVAIERGRDDRQIDRKKQPVFEPNDLQTDDVEEVAEVRVGQPVRRRRRALEPGQLRQTNGDLPQIAEGREVDPSVRRQAPLEAGEQRLDVEHAVAQAIADDGVGSLQQIRRRRDGVFDLEDDLGMSRRRARDHLGQIVDPSTACVRQRGEQVAFPAADLQHRRIRRGSAVPARWPDRGAGSRAPPDCAAPRWRDGSTRARSPRAPPRGTVGAESPRTAPERTSSAPKESLAPFTRRSPACSAA